MVDDVFEIGGFHFPTEKSIGRTKLILGTLVSREWLRIEKSSAEIAITAHRVSVKTLDCRDQFGASVCTDTAPDALVRVNLPNEFIAGHFLLTGKKTGGTGDASDDTISAT